MWPFERKKAKECDSNLLMAELRADRGLDDLTNNDAELRVWLPEARKQGLQEVAGLHIMTSSKYLREFFVVYLYGE